MMKLWRRRALSDERDDDGGDTELDIDLESGFSSDSSSSLNASAFGRSPGEERRRLVRSQCVWCSYSQSSSCAHSVSARSWRFHRVLTRS